MPFSEAVDSRVLLTRLRATLAEPGGGQERLDRIVRLVAEGLVAEVCSVYLRREDILELSATEGLNPDSVHLTRLRVGQGLVGLIAETAEPISTRDASHTRGYRFLPETGEEGLSSFLGVPIQRLGEVLGVLVVQNRDPRDYTDDETYALEVVAMVIAEMAELGAFVGPGADPLLRGYFPGMPCYEHFVSLQKSVFVPLVFFLVSHLGTRTGIYYINSTALPVCDNHRISRHKVFAGLAQRGKTSMGWFFGFKLHLVFNNDNEIVALKLTPGNVHDTTPVPALTRDLIGKLFGDKGYIGQKLAEDLLRRGLTLFTRVRKNMKSLPMSLHDKVLLNARNMAETIIGQIKEFSSLNLSKHRSVINAFVHIIAAITAYQINPFKPKLNLQPRYQLETTA